MKRFLIFLLILLIAVPLILGGVLFYSYQTTTEESVPAVSITYGEQTFAPNTYSWHQPLIAGIMEKDFSGSNSAPTDLGLLSGSSLPLSLSETLPTTASLKRDGTQLWNGTLEEWSNYKIAESGTYSLEILATQDKPEKAIDGYGTFSFNFTFQVQLEPQLYASASAVTQGDVLAITLTQLEGKTPTITTDLEMQGDLIFTEGENGEMSVFIPTSYNREVGSYKATITVDSLTWDIPFTVVAGDFPRQDMTIDTSDPVISEANSAAAYQQYRDKIYPFFETSDPTRYWEGTFVIPAEAELSTEYGLRRYTNGSTTPSRHVGIDIAADENDVVVAPGNGKVVLAEYLLNTGNTLVIEHGGGLKTYFFHMNELSVAEGDIVTKGDKVGLVGSTGYSTGPHLHYEVRIGNQSINPTLLYNGKGNIYFTPTEETKIAPNA